MQTFRLANMHFVLASSSLAQLNLQFLYCNCTVSCSCKSTQYKCIITKMVISYKITHFFLNIELLVLLLDYQLL